MADAQNTGTIIRLNYEAKIGDVFVGRFLVKEKGSVDERGSF